MIDCLNQFLNVVLSIVKNIDACIRPQVVTGSERIRSDRVHVSLKARSFCWVILYRINFIVSERRLDFVVDVNQIDVKSYIQKLPKFLICLLFQVKLPMVLLIRMDRVLKLMPSVPFKRVEQIVIGGVKIIVVVKFLGLLSCQANRKEREKCFHFKISNN